VFWSSTIVSIQPCTLTWSPCFALWKQIDVRLCYVFRVCIQELSQLRRSTGRNIGFSPYYCIRVKKINGTLLFMLQLTDTSVLRGQDRAGWNSSLLTCCVFAGVWLWKHMKIYNLRYRFISIPFLLGSTPALSVSFTDCTLARADVWNFCYIFHVCSYDRWFGYITLRCQMLLLHIHE